MYKFNTVTLLDTEKLFYAFWAPSEFPDWKDSSFIGGSIKNFQHVKNLWNICVFCIFSEAHNVYIK